MISIPLGGYQFGLKDQLTTIPIYRRHLDPTLYPNDYLYPQPNEGRSIDLPFIVTTNRFFPNLETQMFVLYLLFHTLWLYALYRLAIYFFHDHRKALFCLLFFITPKFVAGTGVLTYYPNLVYRTISMPFAILSLTLFLQRRPAWASLSMLLAALFHPLTALYVSFPLFLMTLWNTFKNRSILVLGIITTFVGIILLFPLMGLPIFMDFEWRAIVEERLPFTLLFHWKIRDWGNFLFFVSIAVAGLLVHRSLLQKHRRLWISMLLTVTLALLVPAIGEVTALAPLIQIQFARSLTLGATFALMLFAGTLFRWLSKPRRLPAILAAIILTFGLYFPQPHLAFLLLIALLLSLLPWIRQRTVGNIRLAPFLFFPLILTLHAGTIFAGYSRDPDLHIQIRADQNDPWIQSQLWAKENTPKDAVFLTDPYRNGWRTFSMRSPAAEYKDGTAAIFSKTFAHEWKRKIDKTRESQELDEQGLRSLAEEIHFDYIVRSKEQRALTFPIVYENTKFRIYSLKEV